MIKNINTKLLFDNRRVIISYKETPTFIKEKCVKTVQPIVVDNFHMLAVADVASRKGAAWHSCSVLPIGTIFPTVYMNRNIPTTLNNAVLPYEFLDETQWRFEFDPINIVPEHQIEQGQWEALHLIIRLRKTLKANMRYWKESLSIPILDRHMFALEPQQILNQYGEEDD